jgi:hypothetical protein
MLDHLLGDFAGREVRVVKTQVVVTSVEPAAGIELRALVVLEQPERRLPGVPLRGLLRKARQAFVAPQAFCQGGFEFEEQDTAAAAAERPRKVVDRLLVLRDVELPDTGENQPRQVTGRDLLNDSPADRIVDAVKPRSSEVEVAQGEFD